MLHVGITGGIGSGKSIVARIFETLGIPVYDADAAARRLMNTNETLHSGLHALFGEQAFLTKNTLNRKWIANVVFNQPDQLKVLNALVHPFVMNDYKYWESTQSAPYTIREAAILFESNTHLDLDYIILVDAPTDIRIRRIRKRDGRSKEEIQAIMQRQWTSEKKRSLVNAVIENNETQLVIPQVIDLHHKLLKQSE